MPRLSIQEKLAAQYLALGMSVQEVAQSTELNEGQLKRLQKTPLFQVEFDRCVDRTYPILAERLTRKLEQLQEPALNHLELLMTKAESEPVQLGAANSILNRGPLAVKSHATSQQQPGQTITFDQGALQAIIGGAVNIGQSSIIAAFNAFAHSLNDSPSQTHDQPPLDVHYSTIEATLPLSLPNNQPLTSDQPTREPTPQ